MYLCINDTKGKKEKKTKQKTRKKKKQALKKKKMGVWLEPRSVGEAGSGVRDRWGSEAGEQQC